jgi:hypothetical protein
VPSYVTYVKGKYFVSDVQTVQKQLGITFEFMQWLGFENVFVHPDQTLNEDKNLQLTHKPAIG